MHVAAQEHTSRSLQAPSRQNKEIIDGAQGKLASEGRHLESLEVQHTSCNIFDPIFTVLGGERVLKSESFCCMGFPLRFYLSGKAVFVYCTLFH